jgi:FkbM family methyltransferase
MIDTITLLDHTLHINKKNDIVVIDLGANEGRFYNEFINYFGIDSIKEYIGVEPNVTLYENYLVNLTKNKNVKMVNKAIYRKSNININFTEIKNHEAGNILANSNNFFKWGEKSPKEYLVQSITIGDLLEHFNVDYVDYLKIDIEGAEYFLIETLNKSICDKINQISIEFHDFIDPELKNKSKEYVQKIIDLGYTLHSSKQWGGRYGTNYMDTLFIKNE